MIKVSINNISAKLTECEPLTSGMIGKLVEVTFSSEWDSLNKIAVFSNGDVTKDILESRWNGNYIPIPHEVLATPNRSISMGIYGYTLVDGEKVLAIPTLIAEIGRTKVGADPSGDESTDPTLPIWAQLQWEIEHFEVPEEQIATQVQAYLDEHPIEIPKATASVLGGVKVGEGLSITADGTLSADGGGYEPPVGGIPKTDLASDVQASLDKADSALQEHQSLAGYATEDWVEDKGYLTQHQSLAAYRTAAAQDIIDASKQDNITDLTTIRSGAALGATALQSVPNTYALKTDLPTKTSDLTNDSGYLTEHQSLSAYRTSAAQDTIDATKQDIIFATPEQFGAVGDGVTDDSEAIQTAIDSGEAVYMAQKTYLVKTPIVINNDFTVLRCDGTIKSKDCNAVYVKASDCNIYIANIENGNSYTVTDGVYDCSYNGLTICAERNESDSYLKAFVSRNRIEVGNISHYEKCICINSAGEKGSYRIIVYNTIKFVQLIGENCIYIDATLPITTTIDENTFFCGGLEGNIGLRTVSSVMKINGNKFYNPKFENLSQWGWHCTGFGNNVFFGIRAFPEENTYMPTGQMGYFDSISIQNQIFNPCRMSVEMFDDNNLSGDATASNLYLGQMATQGNKLNNGIARCRNNIWLIEEPINDAYINRTMSNANLDISNEKFALNGLTVNVNNTTAVYNIYLNGGYGASGVREIYINFASTSTYKANVFVGNTQVISASDFKHGGLNSVVYRNGAWIVDDHLTLESLPIYNGGVR